MASYNTPLGFQTFKTPFYNIEVAAADSSNYVPLPEAVYRLIKKIEITETQESCLYNHQITIVIAEGSREPYSPTAASVPSNVYGTNTFSGSLNNKSGFITDLQFLTSMSGVTDIASTVISSSSQTLANTINENDGTKKITGKGTPQKPKFLFQEFNKIRIRWGYLEDKEKSTRTMTTIIYTWQTDFGEDGNVETTITCLGANALYGQLGFSKGISITNTPASDILKDSQTQSLTTKQVLENIATKLGIKAYISDNIKPEKTTATRRIPAGITIDKFLTQLGKETRCYYIPFIDPVTDKFSFIFVPEQEYDQQLGIKQAKLFYYKAPNSILKSLSIKADFSGHFGSYNAQYRSDGKPVSVIADSGEETVVLYDKQYYASNDPSANGNNIPIAGLANKVYGDGIFAQRTEINPNSSNQKYAEQKAINDAKCLKSNLVFIEFTSLGYTRLSPPFTVEFGNIGNRYSGKYKLFTVTHVLDENGYTCRGSAKSESLGGKNNYIINSTKGVDSTEPQVEIKLIDPISEVSGLPSEDPDSIETYAQKVLGIV